MRRCSLCGKKLTAHEIEYYGNTCESCESVIMYCMHTENSEYADRSMRVIKVLCCIERILRGMLRIKKLFIRR